jgi:general secretion pathway protein I
MTSSRPPTQGGFTLIEAIVALVIMTAALTGLFSWVNTDLITLRRVEAVIVTQELLQEALRQIDLLPVEEKQEGGTTLGEYQLQWEARLVEPVMPSRGRGRGGSLGLYDISLYDVSFSLHTSDTELGQWSVRRLSYQQVRQPDNG